MIIATYLCFRGTRTATFVCVCILGGLEWGAEGLGATATDVVSSAFHKDEIGLDTDTGMKLNCDEAWEE